MTLYNCLLCANLKEDEDGEFVCPAFPKGIPQNKLEESDVELRKKPCKGEIKFLDRYSNK